jgi:RNA polymerase sigma factor (sigma-70 family)
MVGRGGAHLNAGACVEETRECRTARRPQHDAVLATEFHEGRREALEVVYRTYVRRIDRYLRGLVNRSGDRSAFGPCAVADLTQETFVRAFSGSARGAFTPSREYEPYLRTIARNCFVSVLRAHRLEVQCAPGTFEPEVQEHQEANDLLDPRVRTIVGMYLTGLPAPLRAVYDLRYVMGYTQHAACHELGLSRRKLRTSEQQLKRGLRKALQSVGVLPADLVAFERAARRTSSDSRQTTCEITKQD